MDTSFPNVDTFVVIEDSSPSEGEEEEPKPSTSRVGGDPDQVVKSCIDSTVTFFCNENRCLIEHQVKLCNEYIDKEIHQLMINEDEMDNLVSKIENEFSSLRNEIYDPYKPIITNLEPVDINELEENIEKKQEVNTSQEEVKTSREEAKTSGANIKTSREEVKLSRKKIKLSREEDNLSRKKIKLSREEVKTSREEVKTSESNIKTSREEVKTSRKEVKLSRKKVKLSRKKFKTSGEKVKVSREVINQLIEEYKTPKETKRIKLEKSIKESLPKEGRLVYTNVVSGQVVFAMKLGMKDPWYRCKVKSVLPEGYILVTFQTGEKLLSSKEIAYTSVSPVIFPVGCRVIAKFTDSNSKCVNEFYAGIIAEPPKQVNNFR